jgi:hypothetical protein
VKKSRSSWKRALGLRETTPPRPGTYDYDPNEDALRRLKRAARKAPKLRDSGRVFDNHGNEITGQVDKRGRPIAPKPEPVAPRSGQRSTAPRRPRAEPITSHPTAGLGVGGPGAGSLPPRGREPAGRGGRSS